MSLWSLGFTIVGAGAIGGVLNALLSENGFFFPRTVDSGGARLLRPGALGNMLTGGGCRVHLVGIVWALCVGLRARWSRYAADADSVQPGITPAALAGAILRETNEVLDH